MSSASDSTNESSQRAVTRSDFRSDTVTQSNALIIACTSYGGHAVPAGGFEWTRILSRANCHRIYLRDSMQHWYQGGLLSFSVDRNHTIDMLSDYIRTNGITRVMTMGSSMGAYGALLIGSLLKSERVLAFAPQTSMDKTWMDSIGDLRWDWKTRELRYLELPDLDLLGLYQAPTVPKHASIFYSGKFDLDRLHAERFKGLAGVELVELDFGEHEIAYQMAKLGLVSSLISEFLDTELPNLFDTTPHAASGGI